MSVGYAEAETFQLVNIERERLESVRSRLRPLIAETALNRHAYLGNGIALWVKEETTQPTGSFKLRSMIATMLGTKNSMVIASAGNAGAALAYAGRQFERKTRIVVTADTPESKKSNIRRAGEDWVELVQVGGSFEDAQSVAVDISKNSGLELAQPFDSRVAIDGVATMGAEIVDQLPDINRIFVPIGGGSGVSGVLKALEAYQPDGNTKVVGVQFEGHDSAEKSFYRSLELMEADGRDEPEIVEATSIDELKVCDGSPVKKMGRECLSRTLRRPDRVEFMTVTAADIGSAIEDEILRRQAIVEADGDIDFTPFPETTGFMAEAGALKYKKLHPGLRDEQWVAIRSGANADPAKTQQALDAWNTTRFTSSGNNASVPRTSVVAGGHFQGR